MPSLLRNIHFDVKSQNYVCLSSVWPNWNIFSTVSWDGFRFVSFNSKFVNYLLKKTTTKLRFSRKLFNDFDVMFLKKMVFKGPLLVPIFSQMLNRKLSVKNKTNSSVLLWIYYKRRNFSKQQYIFRSDFGEI